MSATTIGKELERHRAEMGRLVADLKARIAEGPDNPRMRRLAPRCGVVRFADVYSNWSAEHYDFKSQYEAVVKAIESAQPDRAAEVVAGAVSTGKLRMGTSCPWTLTLHPDVVEHLKEVLK